MMHDPLSTVSIKYKLAAAFVGVCLVAFGVGGYLVSTSARDALEKEITMRLQSQASGLSNLLDSYLQQLARRTEDFASDGYIREHTQRLIELPMERQSAIRSSLVTHLTKNKFPLIPGIRDLVVYDDRGNRLAGVGLQPPVRNDEPMIRASLSVDTLWFSPILFTKRDSTPVLAMATPLWDIGRMHRVGSLVFYIDIEEWINRSQELVEQEEIRTLYAGLRLRLMDVDGLSLEFAIRDTSAASIWKLDHVTASKRIVQEQHLGLHVCEDNADRFGFTGEIASNRWKINAELSAMEAMTLVSGLRSQFLGAGLLFAVVALVLLFFPMRFLVRPLESLKNAAKAMAEGDLGVRVEATGKDEIGELSHSFNRMAASIQERTKSLEHMTVLLERRSKELQLERDLLTSVVHSMEDGLIYLDIEGNVALFNEAAQPIVSALHSKTQSVFARRCMIAGAEGRNCFECLFDQNIDVPSCTVYVRERVYEIISTQLESSEGKHGRILVSRDITERTRIDEHQAHQERLAMLGEIVAVMAHELNNPLAAISMYNQMMEQELAGDSPYREHVDVIKRNADICKKTIRDLLDYSRTAVPELSEFDLNDLLTDVVQFLRPMYEKGNVAFDLRFLSDACLVESNEIYVRQILVNLLMNAIQAMGEKGGKVTVETRCEREGTVGVTVVDTGPGIPLELQAKIFEPFYTTKPAGKGTGLGLSTARRITEALQGRLELVHSEPGQTVFSIELPRSTTDIANNEFHTALHTHS